MVTLPQLIVVLLFVKSSLSVTQQSFTYTIADNLTVQQQSGVKIQLSMATAVNQYLSEAGFSGSFNITKYDNLTYNILFFNGYNSSGPECYQYWVTTNLLPYAYPCDDLSNKQVDQLPPCGNYSNCNNQTIQFSLQLEEQLFKTSYLVFQNLNNVSVTLSTTFSFQMIANNSWFYWGVALTCLLLITLVIYAGFILYWLLKYKKIKKMFQQFKLTQQQMIKID